MTPTLRQQTDALKLVIDEKRRAGATDVACALQAALNGLVQRAAWAGNVTPAADLKNIPQQPLTLYKEFETAYRAWHKSTTNMEARMDGGQGRAMNEIIAALRDLSSSKDDAGALKSWKYLLEHWDDLGEFLHKQKTLTAINKYLAEIVETIRKANAPAPKVTQPTNNPAAARQRQKLKDQLSEVENSIRYLESCTPYPDQTKHLGQATARKSELEQQLSAL